MKVLVTGFDPFGGEKINPAFEAVKALPDSIEGIEIIKEEIPTVFYKSLEAVEALIIQHSPQVVICVGQAGGRSDISLEKVGINLNEARIPDNDGNQPQDSKVFEDGETAYFSNLPIKGMLKALHENNIPASISYTAGTYVCNHVLYGVSYLVDKKYPSIRSGFIHVPYLPQQVIGKSGVPSMPVEVISQALELCVKASLKDDSDVQYLSGTTH